MSAPVPPPSPSPVPRRQVLVVLGMHRGGTSAVAGMLHRLGVDFGPRLMPANADNPAGYYEHNDVVNLHDRFLGRLGAAWDDPFPPRFDAEAWASLAPAPGLPTYRVELLAILQRDFPAETDHRPTPPWGLKDPRLCLLLPWWDPFWAVLEAEPLFVVVLRSPEAVAASLHRRDGMSPAKAEFLWLQHLLRAERGTRGRRRCFVDYDRFLADWRGTTGRIGEVLGVTWPRTPAALSAGEADFLDPALRHHVPADSSARGPQPSHFSWTEDARVVLFPDGPGETAVLDRIYQEMSSFGQFFEALDEHRETDAARQLQAQRRLTRWYEKEWQTVVQEGKENQERFIKREQKLRQNQTRQKKSSELSHD